MNLFYTPDIKGDTYLLSIQESSHISRVLRLEKGKLLHLTDGRGNLYSAEIIDNIKKQCLVRITDLETDFGKRDYSLHIAISPTKNIGRFEWFLEKATEIRIDEITPIICYHSERKIIKPERLQKIIISGLKQSIKAYIPELYSITDFNKFIKQPFKDVEKFIAYIDKPYNTLLQDEYSPGKDALILIGPEGDFSHREIELAKDCGFIPISLGNIRLRTETAGIVACHTINMLNNG